MKRKICVVTGSRADYGLLKGIIKQISHDPDLHLQLVATGSHLSPDFGLTYRELEDDGFQLDRKVEMLTSSDSPSATAKSLGLCLIGFGDVFEQLRPDLLLVLGDRYEIFGAVTAALFAKIPVAHLHGGELTQGAYDDALRHSITKMSHLHFVAASEYRNRVIQLGEQPQYVYNVGGLGVDSLKKLKLLDRSELERSLNYEFAKKNLLVTFHPVTLSDNSDQQQLRELLNALDSFKDINFMFTLPNADTGSRALKVMIEEFVLNHENAKAYSSLGYLRYLSCMALMDGVVGNSSSGLLEAPALGKGSINIGDRQKGRLSASSVINSKPCENEIREAIKKLYSVEFQKGLAKVKNPYGNGGASEKILEIIKATELSVLPRKTFYNHSNSELGLKSE